MTSPAVSGPVRAGAAVASDAMRNRTALALARLAEGCFSYGTFDYASGQSTHHECTDWLAELLFEHELPDDMRSVVGAVPQRTGALATALLAYCHGPGTDRHIQVPAHLVQSALRALELDGYEWRDGRLRSLEEDVFDVADAEGVLLALYRELGLQDLDQVEHDLKKTDELYLSGHWGDAIKHSRDVFEKTLSNTARRLGASASALREPRLVRDALRDAGLVSAAHVRFLAALYSWLSEDGGHPNMAEQESARICRQQALSAAHFVLLRLRGRVTP